MIERFFSETAIVLNQDPPQNVALVIGIMLFIFGISMAIMERMLKK